jgi:threonine dehydrogenase-like Zn-dependent dehydrogenase
VAEETLMKAVTWQGERDVRVETVPDPTIATATDLIIRVTSTGLCGSDLHLYESLGRFLDPGDILGHEAMGIVEEVGRDVRFLRPGDRVVVPFNVSCGSCYMCTGGLQSQCEATQGREHGTGGAIFGFSKLYGQIPGGQAEYLRVPFGNTLPIKVPKGPKDQRFLFLSDVLPTAWQAVQYADTPEGGTLVVLGLGPIGDMCTRIARELGVEKVIGVDLVPERLERARRRGITVIDLREHAGDLVELIRDRTEGRGADAVIDAVGMEAHGSGDRLAALYSSIDVVRRGGTISLAGVYGGMADPIPMLTLFDKQVQVRMGQANVWNWAPQILGLLTDQDPLGVDDFASHTVPLEQAAEAYENFQKKVDGTVKVVFEP